MTQPSTEIWCCRHHARSRGWSRCDTITPGDLLLIIQMEDAAINSVGAGGGSLTFRGTGTPRWVVDPRTNTNADLGIEGYPNGDAVESLALSGWIIRWRGSATHPARIFPIDIV